MIEAINNTFSSDKDLKILNFYWDSCPPCHTFMPLFIDAEKRYWDDFDFIIVNCWTNPKLSQKYWVRSTPTIIVQKWEEIVFNNPWAPNWVELKKVLLQLSGKNEADFSKEESSPENKKRFFWLF